MRDGSGKLISRTRKSVGDKVVEEIHKGGETTRTIKGMDEADVATFESNVDDTLTRRRSFFRGWSSMPLEGTLQEDIDRLKKNAQAVEPEAPSSAEQQPPAWHAAWDNSLQELKEYGFEEATSRNALTTNNGDLKAAMKDLLATERALRA